MTAIKFIVLFILTIFIQQSPCLCADEEPQYKIPRVSPLSVQLDELRRELQNTVKENNIANLKPIFDQIQAIEASEAEWETVAKANNCIRWPGSKSWQATVKSHFLVADSLDPTYWCLIAEQTKRSLHDGNVFEALTDAILRIFTDHPVTRKRFTMYLLAMVTKEYKSPIAQLMTANHLKILKPSSKTAQKLITIAQLNAGEEYYMQFLRTLPPLSTTNQPFAHHFVQLGDCIDPHSKGNGESYDDSKARAALEHFLTAGRMGDFEGYRKAARLQKEWMLRNEGSDEGVNQMVTNIVLSCYLGNPDAETDVEEIIAACPEDAQEEKQTEWEELKSKISMGRNEIRIKIERILKS